MKKKLRETRGTQANSEEEEEENDESKRSKQARKLVNLLPLCPQFAINLASTWHRLISVSVVFCFVGFLGLFRTLVIVEEIRRSRTTSLRASEEAHVFLSQYLRRGNSSQRRRRSLHHYQIHSPLQRKFFFLRYVLRSFRYELRRFRPRSSRF